MACGQKRPTALSHVARRYFSTPSPPPSSEKRRAAERKCQRRVCAPFAADLSRTQKAFPAMFMVKTPRCSFSTRTFFQTRLYGGAPPPLPPPKKMGVSTRNPYAFLRFVVPQRFPPVFVWKGKFSVWGSFGNTPNHPWGQGGPRNGFANP